MKKILLTILIFLRLAIPTTAQQSNQPVNGWNCFVHLPGSYNGVKKYPAIVFFPGIGEVGTNPAQVIANGPGAFINMGWNGNVSISGTTTEFIVCSLQPPTAYPREDSMKLRIDSLISRYRIDTANIFLTGLSHGGWCATSFVSDPVNNFSGKIRAVVGVESVLPAFDNAPWPQSYGIFAATKRSLIFEQINDYRTGDQLVNFINTTANGNGVFVQTNFGGGGHCCWEYFYGGYGRNPEYFTIDGYTQNIYEWMARQVATKTPGIIDQVIIIQSNKHRRITVRSVQL